MGKQEGFGWPPPSTFSRAPSRRHPSWTVRGSRAAAGHRCPCTVQAGSVWIPCVWSPEDASRLGQALAPAGDRLGGWLPLSVPDPQDLSGSQLQPSLGNRGCETQLLLGGSSRAYFKPPGIFRVGIPCPCVTLTAKNSQAMPVRTGR